MITVSDRSLSMAEQAAWVDDVRGVIRRAPLVRPWVAGGVPMKVRSTAAGKLGWVATGSYQYSPTQRDGRSWPEIPQRWIDLANEVAGVQPWDSVIINWYDGEASLGWHADQDEVDTTRPIVTVSLGDTCSWAVRGEDKKVIERTRLESGAVTLLAGKYRNMEHTVERIIRSPLFSPLDVAGRISATIRVAGEPLCT